MSNDTEERNERAKKAYGALLTVTARTPNNDAYRNFSVEVSTVPSTKRDTPNKRTFHERNIYILDLYNISTNITFGPFPIQSDS